MQVCDFGRIQTADPGMIHLMSVAENVASSRATILICGESGTGKELLARYLHDKSSRREKRFVAINCAAMPEGLLESELFGYERGAFTGAFQAKPGKFELAHESTFLLDEISEIPLSLQAKLLRVLQEGEVERLGGRQPIKVNVRIIATTNRDLKRMVEKGEFREDLYYRLNVIPLSIPALRLRPQDIILLARSFVEISCLVNGKEKKTLSANAIQKLLQWHWPGNIRELENVMERVVLLSQSLEITADEIQINGFNDANSVQAFVPGMKISDAERQLILSTLEYTGQNRTRAAELLGISIRTLRNKINEYRSLGVL